MVELSLVLPPKPDERWTLATQMGVTNVVFHPLEIGDGTMFWEYDRLQIMCNWFDGAGIDVSVIEGSVPITDKTRLGLPGRDEDIETFKTFLRRVGQLGIPVVAYDWMAGLRWTRTNVHRAARGGSLVTEFDREKMSGGPPPAAADTTAEELFENLRYFLERVVPVAEEADVRLALHPDDPPRSEVRGMPRIANSVENCDRVLDVYDSEYNGLTFCQGTSRQWARTSPRRSSTSATGSTSPTSGTWRGTPTASSRRGTTPARRTCSPRCRRTPTSASTVRTDHVPTIAGQSNDNPGYHTKARMFAIGYMRGLLESV